MSATVSPGLVVQPSTWWRDHLAGLLQEPTASRTHAASLGGRCETGWLRSAGLEISSTWRPLPATVRNSHDPIVRGPQRGSRKGGPKHGTLLDPSVLALPFVCLCTTPGISKSKTKANWGRRSVPHTRRQQSVF